jgi:hypothetical protein
MRGDLLVSYLLLILSLAPPIHELACAIRGFPYILAARAPLTLPLDAAPSTLAGAARAARSLPLATLQPQHSHPPPFCAQRTPLSSRSAPHPRSGAFAGRVPSQSNEPRVLREGWAGWGALKHMRPVGHARARAATHRQACLRVKMHFQGSRGGRWGGGGLEGKVAKAKGRQDPGVTQRASRLPSLHQRGARRHCGSGQSNLRLGNVRGGRGRGLDKGWGPGGQGEGRRQEESPQQGPGPREGRPKGRRSCKRLTRGCALGRLRARDGQGLGGAGAREVERSTPTPRPLPARKTTL